MYGFVHLNGKRDFAGMIELSILGWGDYCGLCGWAPCSYKGPFKRDAEESESQKEM